MLRLTATFKISLASPLFVDRPPRQEGVGTIQALRYPVRIDDSDVEIALVEAYHAMTIMDRGENILRGPIWAVPQVRVSVSRSETVGPSPIQHTAQGGRDFRDRWPYFQERDPIYRGAAIEALRRIVCFFKYRQAHALLRYRQAPGLRRNDSLLDFMSALQWTDESWSDETGQELPTGITPLRELSLYGIELDDEVGIKALAAADDPALQQALAEPPLEPALYEELLSDARAALFQGGLRRAILELAIACEVAIKQSFFDKGAEAALSPYFDEKRQVRSCVGGVANLLGEPVERILGQNFGKTNKRAYAHIHHLFECRNQIAHEGKPTYKNRRGRAQIVDQAVAQEWFKAADHLFHWLRRMRP
jgi:hypothetical protein